MPKVSRNGRVRVDDRIALSTSPHRGEVRGAPAGTPQCRDRNANFRADGRTFLSLDELCEEARRCTICADRLPLGPRPVFRVSATARILIIGQAPGTKVHQTGIPWNDASGERLRSWLNLDREQFYDSTRIAIMPMGFCYPGRLANGGDAPPRPECAPAWHDWFFRLMPDIKLTLLVGSYAQTRYLGPGTMTDRVRNFAAHPKFFALPHPSWRTVGWEQQNPWFGTDVLPALRHSTGRL